MTCRHSTIYLHAFVLLASLAIYGQNIAMAATPDQDTAGKVQVTTKTIYYDVTGESTATIYAQVQGLGPKTKEGKTVYGETEYTISWKYDTGVQAGGFVIKNPQVTLNLECTLPRRKPSSKPVPAFDAEWQRFMSALVTHERGHIEIGSMTAEKMLAKLSEKHLFKTMEELKSDAESEIKTIMDEGDKLNVSYDKKTNHGATQGATLR